MRIGGRRIAAPEWAPAFGLLLVLVILWSVLKGNAPTDFDVQGILVTALPLTLVTLGQYFVILSNGFDLSLGPLASITSSITALMLGTSAGLSIALCMIAAVSAGLVNGILVGVLRLQPLVATLATMSIWQGVALLILPQPGGLVPLDWSLAMTGSLLPYLPAAGVLLVVATLLAVWFMRTRSGLHLRAVGGNATSAAATGVKVTVIVVLTYVVAALFAGAGGVVLTIANSSGSPTAGNSFILSSIAGVAIGGIAMSGGQGSPLSAVFGALILAVVGQVLYFSGLSSFYTSLFNGVILIVAIVVAVGLSKMRSWRHESLR